MASKTTTRDERLAYMDQKEAYYLEKGENLQGRKVEFLKDNPASLEKTAVFTTAGALLGMQTMGGAGALIGTAVGTPAGPPGMLICSLVGLGIGLVAGAVTGGVIANELIYPDYSKWLETENGKECAAEMMDILADDPLLAEYRCGISLYPALSVVRTPQGQVYDEHLIKQEIKNTGLDPLTRQPLKESDLIYSPEDSAKVSMRLVEFLEERIEAKRINSRLLTGAQALLVDTQKHINNLYNAELAKLQTAVNNQEITTQQYRTQAKLLAQKFL